MSEDVSFRDILKSWQDNWLLAKIGFYLGLILAVAGLGLLGYSEYSGAKKAQALEQGASNVTSIAADKVDPANEGKLVHVVGPAQTKETLTDAELGVSTSAIRLSRKVEMYQWQEKKESKKKGNDTITSYTYDRTWSDKPIDSSKFNQQSGHENPPWPFEAKSWQAGDVTLGSFTLAPSLIDKIKGEERLPATDSGKLPDNVKVHDGQFYKGDPASPAVGDARIEYKVAKPGTISVVAKQAQNGLVPFQDDGQTIELVQAGTQSAGAMFETAKTGHAILTWLLRVGAFVLLAFGLYLVGQPNVYRADSIPLVGDILALGGISFGITVGLALALLVSGGILLVYLPLLSAPLLAGAAVILVASRLIGARQAEKAAGTSKLPAEAAKVARAIKRRGGKVEVYGDEPDMNVSVTLEGKKFTDDALAELNAFPRINTLWITNTSISGTGLANIKVKALDSLYVRGVLSPRGLQALGTMNGLKKLNLNDCKISDQGLAGLKGMARLEEADLDDTELTDAGLVHLKGWTGLKSLKLGGGSFTGSGLDNCKDLKQLKSLWIQATKLTDPGMVGLKNLVGLKELYIGINDINGNGLGYIQNLTQLEVLHLGSSKVGDKGLAFLAKLARLRELDLSRSKVTDAGLAHLKVLASLKKLDLNRCAVTDQGLAHLSGLASLEELCIDRTKITDAGLPAVARLANLKQLHLDHTAITDAGLIHLNRLTNLSWVTLFDTKVTEERVEGLRQALPGANVDLFNWRGIADDLEYEP
jgi:uncharacterized protein YjbI with pentapeptide repeats